jgi:hypothetical protein
MRLTAQPREANATARQGRGAEDDARGVARSGAGLVEPGEGGGGGAEVARACATKRPAEVSCRRVRSGRRRRVRREWMSARGSERSKEEE